MSSVKRILCTSWLALIALLAFLCLFQVSSNGGAEGLHLFGKKARQEWDDYDSSFAEDRDLRRIIKIKAASANWETFKKHPLFVEPIEEGLTQLPVKQLEFEYETGRKNIALFKEIVNDAIKFKDDSFASIKLITKWSVKLIGTLIKNRRDELALKERYDPKGVFFTRMADALSKIVETSTEIKHDKGYHRRNVDVQKFVDRTMEILNLGDRVLEVSPVGVFLKWDTLKLYMDNSTHPLHGKSGMDEASDLFAQFRGIGYESAAFMANRVVDLLRSFARGQIPKVRHFV